MYVLEVGRRELFKQTRHPPSIVRSFWRDDRGLEAQACGCALADWLARARIETPPVWPLSTSVIGAHADTTR